MENTASAPAATAATQDKTWVLVFAFCFIGLLIDGADLMLLSYSLTSLKAEFGLSNLQAGSLGSVTLAGMASVESTAAGRAIASAGSRRWSGPLCCSPSAPLFLV